MNWLIPLWLGSLAVLSACGGGSSASAGTSASQSSAPGVSGAIRFDPHVLVDQFGYRPGDPKVAVIRDPHVGFDRHDTFTPGDLYEVRRAADGGVVFKGAAQPWKGGAVEASSGDSGWWFDFSSVRAPGEYFIYDVQRNVRSATFRIDENVYKNVLKAAMRMFYYQRSGIEKEPPFAKKCWSDGAAYMGPGQDTEARDIMDPHDASKVRDLSGGWFDAGDTNKYVTNADQPVHQLLTAYQENPAAFGDDFDIPESGNGIPDVLDEVNWEIKWLQKMQYADGSAALKVGETVYVPAAPPSSDHSARYYVPSCTSSTIAVSGMFAHAAYVFRNFKGLAREAQDLKARAIRAWRNYQSIPQKQTHCDNGVIHAGRADWSVARQNAEAVVAAIYLFAVTGGPTYDQYVRAHYTELNPYHNVGWTVYDPQEGEALLFYTTLAHANPALRKLILRDKLENVRSHPHIYGFVAQDDLYRAYMPDAQYHWGSNQPRANYGNTNMDVITYKLPVRNDATYRDRALGILHYFDGVNPFAMVYMSNMYRYGATRSANEIYHSWFWHGTKWSDARTSACGPAPGYVPGGPNAQAAADGVPTYLVPPTGQPPQKAYRDWNVGSPQDSWVITEPGIYYQSSFVELLSKFVR